MSLPALDGLKVVEFAHVIAGPLAGTLLADLGASVVHVEPPGTGDAAREMGPTKDSVPLWWKVSARNKRSVTLDLRQERGRALARALACWADVVITSLRADRLRDWGLDWPALHALNPCLVMLQVSGFGASSSLANAPGFGKVGEARSGVVALTGFPDGPPVHTGFSHGDSVTALTGAFGILAALWRRERDPEFAGEWIDLALFEGLFRLVEWQIIVHDQLGIVPQRSGNRLAIAPGAAVNTYLTAEREWITVTSATPRSVSNIVALVGLPAEDYATAAAQRAGADRLDDALRAWIAKRPTEECLERMAAAEVVASRIFTVTDILADATYREREDVISIEDEDLGPVRMQAVVPRLENHRGQVWRTGPSLGADNELVYRDWLGLPEAELSELRRCRTI
jgi:crotonobetainyl-CoA:carnitine CoA-transferase CaiB-like acyl-CoA transferase